MDLIGITPEINKIQVCDPEAEFPAPSEYTMPFFCEEKSTGNIEIYFYGIDGEVARYLQMGDGKTASLNAKEKLYKIVRLKEPIEDMKYRMPAGQPTRPWFPPALVDKFNKKEKIPTLILTEGVFKAMRGSIAGLDVVGLPSITCYKGKDGKLYRDIVRLIETCQVENVVILWDGDCLNFSKKDLQVGDEITTRPRTFFNSAKKIAELIKEAEYDKTRACPSIWFSHVKSDSMPGKPKGLDDILIEAKAAGVEQMVVHDCLHFPDKPFYFYQKNITSATPFLYKYFRLHDAESFYNAFIEEIGQREFKFDGSIYKWSEGKNKLEMEVPWWAKEIKWVGDEFFIEQNVPGAMRARRVLTHWKETNFKKLFNKPDFHKDLQHYRAFCNIPNHDHYQQVIETSEGLKYYNRYFPFPHVEQEGSCDTIIEFVKHIFGVGEVNHALFPDRKYQTWELGLDYIQLLLTKPTQMLPILCLYSPENNTGKSTFGKLLMWMFGDNAIPIGNADLSNDFNETYVDKLLAICDETLLERKKDAERVKAMSTNDQVLVNPKGQKQYTIDFFCKFIFTSNNLRMIYVNKHDQRYWIHRVPVLTKDDPTIVDKMKSEIPALVWMLRRRKLVCGDQPEGRMWFHPSLLKTSVFEDMVRVNEPTDATNLREQIREWFIADPAITEIRMTLKEIKSEFFNGSASIPWLQEIIKDYIGVDLARDPNTGEAIFERGTYTKYETYTKTDGDEDTRPVKKAYRGRPYVFQRSHFLSGTEVAYPVADGVEEAAPSASLTHPPVIQTAMELDDKEPVTKSQGSGAQEDDLPF